MIELSSTIPSQIRFLLHTLNEANVDSVFRDLCQVLSLHYFISPNSAIDRLLSLSLIFYFFKKNLNIPLFAWPDYIWIKIKKLF
jgi:hypothetical protein